MSPDDLQWALRVALALGGSILAGITWIVKVIWGRQEQTRKDLDDLRVAVERDHPSNTDFREFSDRIVRAVDRMSDQMGKLQAEIHTHAIALARTTK